MSALPASRRDFWRTALMLLPQRRFSAAERARAGAGRPSLAALLAAAANLGVLLGAVMVVIAPSAGPAVSAAVALYGLGIAAAMWAAWLDPGHRAARSAYWLLPMALGVVLGYSESALDARVVVLLAMLAVAGAFALWFTIVHRHRDLAARLALLDERDRAVALARQLASAQIEPHFLFNSLASLRHWVDTRDERAAALLEALTGFLRATLPLFERPLLPVADEAEAVQRYLEVMQLRLGPQRLRFTVAVDAAAAAALLPPGLLLTLVENAVEHGVLPSLAGGEVALHGKVDTGGRVHLEVRNTGAPWSAAAASASRGIGLANCRARLALACGPAAALRLEAGPGGDGCVATLSLPPLAQNPRP